MGTYRDIMQHFTVKDIPDLDICVLAALELFVEEKVPKVTIPYKRPLVVGSGNAAATGRIIFRNKDAIFADESSYESKLKKIKAIDGVVLISASGGKHAPIIAKKVKSMKKKVLLITSNKQAQAKQYADKIYIFPKNREPYTYNTSTYMGMMLGHTKEDPKKILQFIKSSVDKVKLADLKKYKRYFLIVPEELEGVIRLLHVKFIELFGRKIARDVETFEYMKHAVTVVPSDELFISFGQKPSAEIKTLISDRHLHISLPKNVDYVAMMAISYYLIGKIQKAHPGWYKQNIKEYMNRVSKVFGKKMEVIVE